MIGARFPAGAGGGRLDLWGIVGSAPMPARCGAPRASAQT